IPAADEVVERAEAEGDQESKEEGWDGHWWSVFSHQCSVFSVQSTQAWITRRREISRVQKIREIYQIGAIRVRKNYGLRRFAKKSTMAL
ncbi:MAG TPA: hypothetical protein PKC99_09035, partial [Anaerolineales bacterium]|nr:hypothetical protein [Anaerolineales bacterium]